MRRTTTAVSASAAALFLGVLLTGCGDAPRSGYAAVGAADPSDGTAATKPAPPPGGVELAPLDGNRADDGTGHSGHPGPTTPSVHRDPADPAPSAGATGSPSPDVPATPPRDAASPNTPSVPGGSPSPQPSGSPAPRPPSPTIPAGPGAPPGLLVGEPAVADTDVRWCQQLTLHFLNTGDHPVTAGTVTFGSHVIGPLGIDWTTIDSTYRLPLPLAPDKPTTGRWRVCVDAWRVPLGMRLDTRDTRFTWSAER
ncbi:hypothetical protein [Streptomyces sp. S186]|uniref:hypothetical protein n=1 Tax=Streptomyces sp. S186 TaxID=3434395 RepID=UPI003F66D5F5